MAKRADFHCCATCIHFKVEKGHSHITYRCARLGYETKPAYQFNCWEPKENVRQLMTKRGIR
ncbi:hypothetical protein J2S00_000280 [Caldalkalibacillus uzonensis]|uniref:Uracil-DNA glycosylase n=1 Tax=Caldalkalibacillus uzonensis TaxID=353224 RepID=A0ABU0CM59_9BACI|nr:hypothetical protein [Caldalkalibacillus uzonensis]MDQ0337510.1 hypothetical protein [Caldalkalibacillus uzonensis]